MVTGAPPRRRKAPPSRELPTKPSSPASARPQRSKRARSRTLALAAAATAAALLLIVALALFLIEVEYEVLSESPSAQFSSATPSEAGPKSPAASAPSPPAESQPPAQPETDVSSSARAEAADLTRIVSSDDTLWLTRWAPPVHPANESQLPDAPARRGASPALRRALSDIGRSTAVVVTAHLRPDKLRAALESLVAAHPGRAVGFPVFVSVDLQDPDEMDYTWDWAAADADAVATEKSGTEEGSDRRYEAERRESAARLKAEVMEVVEEFAAEQKLIAALDEGEESLRAVPIALWRHTNPFLYKKDSGHVFVNVAAYAKISRHYRWLLTRVFSADTATGELHKASQGAEFIARFRRIIILEDDILVSPDFFDYMAATARLLHQDPSLYCISAWNDNGKAQWVHHPYRLRRTDFFPGLGWMMTRAVFADIVRQWPAAFWDDWMREPGTRKDRQCVVPEWSRTENIGDKGVSKSFSFKDHVGKVVRCLPENITAAAIPSSNSISPIGWDPDAVLLDLSADTFKDAFLDRLRNATVSRVSSRARACSERHRSDVILRFSDAKASGSSGAFVNLARRLGVMDDERNGVLRGSYMGVVSLALDADFELFLVPKSFEERPGVTVGARECL